MEEHHGVSTSTMPAPLGASHTPPPAPPPTRPKIRIIHIIAPEIIKTDVANFRDLVQRLTGKPTYASTPAGMATTATLPPVQEEEEEEKETTKKRPMPAPATATGRMDDFAVPQEPSGKKRKIKCEVKVEEGGFGDYCSSDLWMDLNPGGFLSFLEEEADVFQGLADAADDFLLPLASSRLDWVGEMYAS